MGGSQSNVAREEGEGGQGGPRIPTRVNSAARAPRPSSPARWRNLNLNPNPKAHWGLVAFDTKREHVREGTGGTASQAGARLQEAKDANGSGRHHRGAPPELRTAGPRRPAARQRLLDVQETDEPEPDVLSRSPSRGSEPEPEPEPEPAVGIKGSPAWPFWSARAPAPAPRPAQVDSDIKVLDVDPRLDCQGRVRAPVWATVRARRARTERIAITAARGARRFVPAVRTWFVNGDQILCLFV